MDNLLSVTWYSDDPIDFEYKEYLLFAYLQKVESSFQNRVLSPHLLHMERIIDELLMFRGSFEEIKKTFNRNRYVYLDNIKLEGENDKFIIEIKELVEFAIPQVQPRIDYGYKILKKNRQILF